MSFGQNLQFLRKMRRGMTQDELAEKMGVSRQTVSKWEMDASFPEMDKALALCDLFSCTLDGLLRENVNSSSDAYISMGLKTVPALRYVRYAVISADPEGDAIRHVREWASGQGIEAPEMIGWDFPFVSQEQINVYHMHGYTPACVLPKDFDAACRGMEILSQPAQRYAVLTIREPFSAPFNLIPNAYKTLLRYLEVNGLRPKQTKEILPCFEKVYDKEGVTCMDICIAVDA